MVWCLELLLYSVVCYDDLGVVDLFGCYLIGVDGIWW